MDKEPDGADMVGQRLGKGERLAGEPCQPLAQSVIERVSPGYDIVGLATAFLDHTMAFAGQDTDIGIPVVGLAKRTLSVERRHLAPERSLTGATAITNLHCHDFARLGIHRQPEPDLLRRWPTKLPSSSHTGASSAVFFERTVAWRGWAASNALT
jgi:hypothetical protein